MNISAGSDTECSHFVIIAMVIIKTSSLNPDVSKLASIEGDWQDLVKREGWECHEHAPLTHNPDQYTTANLFASSSTSSFSARTASFSAVISYLLCLPNNIHFHF